MMTAYIKPKTIRKRKPGKLKLVTKVQQNRKSCIDSVKYLGRQAQNGNIIGLIWAAIDAEGRVMTNITGAADEDAFKTLGAAALLQRRVMDMIEMGVE